MDISAEKKVSFNLWGEITLQTRVARSQNKFKSQIGLRKFELRKNPQKRKKANFVWFGLFKGQMATLVHTRERATNEAVTMFKGKVTDEVK